MKQAYRRWVCGVLAALACLMAFCAAVVYAVDPCLYYRMPTKWESVFFNERFQAAGLARNLPADTVLLGSSMAANYRGSHIAEELGGSAVRITIPDGYFSEFDLVMDTLFQKAEPPKRIIFVMDANILMRSESGVTAAMPKYLYNENPVDDVQYLFNKDALYYSFYVLMANRWGEGQTSDEGFTWDDDVWWNHMTAMEEYDRPSVEEKLPTDAFMEDTLANLAVVESWLKEHPDTQFDIFFPPYSILYWDKTIRQGRTDAVFTALEESSRRLIQYDNVRLHGFLFDEEIVDNLDNYCDYIHHSGAAGRLVLKKLASQEQQLTQENLEQTLVNWRNFVVNYDYEKFWDTKFWEEWNRTHPAA